MDHEKGRDAMKGEGGVMSVGKLISAGKTREPGGGIKCSKEIVVLLTQEIRISFKMVFSN